MCSKIVKNSTQVNHHQFRHQELYKEEILKGCCLGIDSWDDTGCAGKHVYVEEFISGRTVNAIGFAPSLGSLNNLPITNVLYAYDTPSGKTVLLEHKNDIYLGPTMEDGLANPIQSEDNDVRIKIRQKTFYGEDISSQTIKFPDGTILPIAYDIVLPYLTFRIPTYKEINACDCLELTSRFDWDPYTKEGLFHYLKLISTKTLIYRC